MKKNVIKTAFAAVCVVAAGMGGFKAYNAAAQSETDMLLAENVEALSLDESGASSGSNSQYKYKYWKMISSKTLCCTYLAEGHFLYVFQYTDECTEAKSKTKKTDGCSTVGQKRTYEETIVK